MIAYLFSLPGRIIDANKCYIDLHCAYFSGNVEAICLPDLPFDVLVGNVEGSSCACLSDNAAFSGVENFDGPVSYAVSTRGKKLRDSLPDVSTRISQLPVKLDVLDITTEDFVELQEKDKSLSASFRKTFDISNTYPKFAVQNNVMVRLVYKSKNLHNIDSQIVLPKSFREKVISLAPPPWRRPCRGGGACVL